MSASSFWISAPRTETDAESTLESAGFQSVQADVGLSFDMHFSLIDGQRAQGCGGLVDVERADDVVKLALVERQMRDIRLTRNCRARERPRHHAIESRAPAVMERRPKFLGRARAEQREQRQNIVEVAGSCVNRQSLAERS